MKNNIRVRFAPSPTGPLHIGGVRTALFNYLFARKHGGTFILRIEDTDQVRYVEGAEKYIFDSLKWCGIHIDEGVNAGGPFEPYRQSERKEKYKVFVDRLLSEKKAYYAFDTPEELESLRKQYEQEKKTFSYDHTLRSHKDKVRNAFTLGDEETQKLISSGIPYVIRFRIPENREVHADDIVRGHVVFQTNTLDDKVIFKSDGLPTYHLANVTDDHVMQITHVIRGEEWLPSLPLHILLYEAFGWEKPQFAHLPLILKPSGQGKLSKRDGDKDGFPVFPLEWKSPEGEVASGYRESGYLPEAVVNMLAFLGWNPGTEQELFSMEELINNFSLEKVQKAGARFDPEKARWFNQQYLKNTDDDILADMVIPVLYERNIKADKNYTKKVCSMVKERMTFLQEFWAYASYFYQAPIEYDSKVISKFWKEDTPGILQEIKKIIEMAEPFSAPALEGMVKAYIEGNNLGFGKIMNPLRLLLVGSNMGPHLFDIMEMLGREETLQRIEAGLSRIK
ncbi:MAG: glutamate--tRNA ligase [Bacteroidales bacterium]|nr:glutamate--tRNA ligase [Bacteroidales bacterium]